MDATLDITEKEWLEQIRTLAKQLGWYTYHTHRSRRSEPGFPDLVLVRDRVLFVELKTETGKATDVQADWLARLQLAGANAFLWRPGDLEDAARELTHRSPSF